jgi:hypothetical protein
MALPEADFEKAIEGVVSAWRVSTVGVDESVGSGEQRGWDDVQIMEKVS